jgi:hypothetical protein
VINFIFWALLEPLVPIEYEVGWTPAPGSTVTGGEKYKSQYIYTIYIM